MPIVETEYKFVSWLVEWGLADYWDQVNLVCRNQTLPT
jgi:hypothetical protein